MSQLLIGETDFTNTAFLPSVDYYLAFGTADYSLIGTTSANGATIIGDVSALLANPAFIPDAGAVQMNCRFALDSVSDNLNICNAEIIVSNSVLGVITELSGGVTLRTVSNGGPDVYTVTKNSDVNTLLAAYSTDAVTLFNLLKARIRIPGSIVGTPGDFVVSIGGLGLPNFSLSVPDGVTPWPSDDEIEITGDGGVELSGEADLEEGGFPLDITGAGGVEVGQDPLVPTPFVLSADVSGIYTLVPGRHFDRVYSRNTDPAQTQDVAIPTPYAKTGYFGA